MHSSTLAQSKASIVVVGHTSQSATKSTQLYNDSMTIVLSLQALHPTNLLHPKGWPTSDLQGVHQPTAQR